MDDLTPEQRHKNMTHIRSKDTKIEVILRKSLWQEGVRYRKNYKELPGKPDIAITKYKIAVFCDGEFFHGKNWPELKEKLKDSNNSDYWISKIQRNIDRDRDNTEKLHEMGWRVLRFWGKDIKKNTAHCVECILNEIESVKSEA